MPSAAVLAFNLDPLAFNRLKASCGALGLGATDVPKASFSRPVGALAGLPVPDVADDPAADGATDDSPFDDPMLVMCGLDEARFDALLRALREPGLPRVPLKAVLTPYNASWSAVRLHGELAREHEAMLRHKNGK